MIETIRILLLIFFSTTSLVAFTLILNFLPERGYSLGGLRTQANNVLDFLQRIGEAENPTDKNHYQFLIRSYIGGVILLIVTVLPYFISL